MEMIKYNYRRQSHLSFGSTTCNQRGKHSAITLPTSDIPSHPHLMASTSSQIFNDQLLRQYFTHLSVYAYKLKTLWFFFVTNIMLSFWVISLGSRNHIHHLHHIRSFLNLLHFQNISFQADNDHNIYLYIYTSPIPTCF